MTTLYLVRHAKAERDFGNDRNRPLTADGTLDADSAAEFLNSVNIDAVYSSPYKRAFDTMLPIAMIRGLDIYTDERLREREAGTWDGSNFLEYIEMQWEDFTFTVEGGESLSEVRSRNISAIRDIISKHPGETVAIGTHGTALSTILNYYDRKFGFKDFMRIIDYMPYIIKLVFNGDKLIIKHEEFHILKSK